MTKRDCNGCPMLGDFCGKPVCRLRQPKKYIKWIETCSNAGNRQGIDFTKYTQLPKFQ